MNNNNNPNYYNINQASPYPSDETVNPKGINFKDYLKSENEVFNDDAIINEALEQNNDFFKIMQKRDKDLKNLTSTWVKGNKSDVIERITSMNDIGIVNSFVLYAIIKTDLKRIDISCSDANNLLPSIEDLVNSRDEHHFLNGILSSWVLLRLFEDVIMSTKCSQALGGGIDLNKEDKIRKYDKFIGHIKRIRCSENFNMYYKRNTKYEGVDLSKFANEVDYFIRKCNA